MEKPLEVYRVSACLPVSTFLSGFSLLQVIRARMDLVCSIFLVLDGVEAERSEWGVGGRQNGFASGIGAGNDLQVAPCLGTSPVGKQPVLVWAGRQAGRQGEREAACSSQAALADEPRTPDPSPGEEGYTHTHTDSHAATV